MEIYPEVYMGPDLFGPLEITHAESQVGWLSSRSSGLVLQLCIIFRK